MKSVLACTTLLLLAVFSFLFSPAPHGIAGEYCGTYVHLASYASFANNCDADGYLQIASEPSALLKPREVRQSRPLYILLGSAIGYPLNELLQGASHHLAWITVLKQRFPLAQRPLLGFYLGFVVLNYGILLASLVLFEKVCRRLLVGVTIDLVLLYSLMVFLVSNQITKAFFWTAHQQMLTFFTPLLCLYLLLRLISVQLPFSKLVALSIGLGTLTLAYGSFVLALPCLWYSLFWNKKSNYKKLVGQAALLGILFVLPTLAWIVTLKLHGVTYYNHEVVRFRQFIWLKDALLIGPYELLRQVSLNLVAFCNSLLSISGFMLAVVLLSTIVWQKRSTTLSAHTYQYLHAVWATLGLYTVFFALLGFYPERLAFTLLPFLLCLLAVRLHQVEWPYKRLVVISACCGWHLYNVLMYGPFS